MQKKSLQTILYSTGGIAAMLLIVIAFNFIVSAVHARIDLTQEKAYTLSSGTRNLLKSLGKLDAPVIVRFYCTQTESSSAEAVWLKTYARRVEDLLSEYQQIAGPKLRIEKKDPQPDTDIEDSARLDGIEAKSLRGADRLYLGIAVKYADEGQAIPFLAPERERLLEYDLTRAISKVINSEKPTVGIMSVLPVFGQASNPMMMRMGQQGSPPWTIITELKNDYNVKQVQMDTDKIDDDIKVLLVIHPKEISDKAQYAIDQFIMRGGKLIAYLDAQCVVDSRQGDQMSMMMGGGGSSLDKLLKAWGVQFDTSKVVADLRYKMKVGRGQGGEAEDQPAWIGLSSEKASGKKDPHPAINREDVATSQIDSIWIPLCGAFTGTPATGLKETVLLQSSEDSQLVDGMLANISAQNMMREFKPSGVNYKLAIRLAGKFKSAFPDGKPADKKDDKTDTAKKDEKKTDDSLKESKDTAVVLFGDADMLVDQFTLSPIQTPFGVLGYRSLNGNLTLAQNLVDQMSGDNNLIAVRSRASLNRPFEKIHVLEEKANEKYQSELKRFEDAQADAQRKINEMQSQKSDKNQLLILSPEQRAELDKLRKEAGDFAKRKRQVEKDLHREVLSLQNTLKWTDIFSVPVAVTASGILIAGIKRNKTSAK